MTFMPNFAKSLLLSNFHRQTALLHVVKFLLAYYTQNPADLAYLDLPV